MEAETYEEDVTAPAPPAPPLGLPAGDGRAAHARARGPEDADEEAPAPDRGEESAHHLVALVRRKKLPGEYGEKPVTATLYRSSWS